MNCPDMVDEEQRTDLFKHGTFLSRLSNMGTDVQLGI
jgi:hypothetical protein